MLAKVLIRKGGGTQTERSAGGLRTFTEGMGIVQDTEMKIGVYRIDHTVRDTDQGMSTAEMSNGTATIGAPAAIRIRGQWRGRAPDMHLQATSCLAGVHCCSIMHADF
jgi:hypothetical protein